MNQELFRYKIFGRLKGRKKNKLLFNKKLKDNKIAIVENLNDINYNIVDIGSGSGESCIFLSFEKPYAKIITCELFEDGNINLQNEIINQNINNVKIYQGNVLEFLDNILIKKYLNEVWILFPDPWPKFRHQKRRLINTNFLIMISNYLKHNGKIFITTDSQSYLKSILQSIYETKHIYNWENQYIHNWNYENHNMPKTKFFKKAKKLNKKPIFIELKKIILEF